MTDTKGRKGSVVIITIMEKTSMLIKRVRVGLNRVMSRVAFLLVLSSVFGMAFANDSTDDGPVFDVTFTDITTGEKTQFYTKPDRIFHIPKVVTQSYEEVQALEVISAQAEAEKALMATFLLEQGGEFIERSGIRSYRH